MNSKSAVLINEALKTIRATHKEREYLQAVFKAVYIQGQIDGVEDIALAMKEGQRGD